MPVLDLGVWLSPGPESPPLYRPGSDKVLLIEASLGVEGTPVRAAWNSLTASRHWPTVQNARPRLALTRRGRQAGSVTQVGVSTILGPSVRISACNTFTTCAMFAITSRGAWRSPRPGSSLC